MKLLQLTVLRQPIICVIEFIGGVLYFHPILTFLLVYGLLSWGSSGGWVAKLLACGARSPGSIPRLATWISEIGYLLLPSRDMAEIPLKRRKSSIQPTNQFCHGTESDIFFFLWSRISFIILWGKFSRWKQCPEKHENCTHAKIHTFTVSERSQRLLLGQLRLCNTRNIENIHTCITTGHGM